ncbi:MAG: RNA-binding cell elongation regulator Jag/EloR [Chloroflexota bacterium]
MANQNESLNVSAKTVEDAIEDGLSQLGLNRDQVNIEIISEGKRGVFGLGSEEAQVRLSPIPTPSPDEADEPPPSAVSEDTDEAAESSNEVVEEDVSSNKADEEPASEIEDIAIELLSQLLAHMGIQADVTARLGTDLVEPEEDPPLVLDVTGRDLGILIGRRSETLYALQYMLRLMISKHTKRWDPVLVDVESYRVRRRKSLHQMAERMAERAANSGKRVILEAMSAHERRIIHMTLRDHPDVFTKSIGSGENRKVSILPK